ncbi:MAG: 2-oxoacid:acceptor oxidoreductase subunit alpha [Dehalococcoidales bacterium]|nr:2-oxoacid:acceptor oxidoreductase subunit alpha [Dehalococcoidales bacterium]
MSTEVNFMVGGEAGQGLQSVGFILAKSFVRGGYHVFADQDYESRIRGGHSFFRVRASDNPVSAITEPLDFLLALNRETIDLHRKELVPKGVIIFDRAKIPDLKGEGLFGIPLEELAETAGNKVMANTVALGAVLGLVDYDRDILNMMLRESFPGKDSSVGEANVKAAAAGYDYARQNFKGILPKGKDHLKPISDVKRMLLNGTDAVALGAIAAGCKFLAAYPMTPTTPIIEYMASKAREYGLVVVQPEDEISAINMVVGAAYTGVRAMTATSGSGFCLMVEGLCLAGITETPAVIVLGQRPGPAVGLPTRTSQEELEFAIHVGSGEFPRAVLAPGTIEEHFWLTVKVFNLAEKYQIPVILLTDHHLATSYATVPPFDLSKVTIDRGILFTDKTGAKPEEYKRHQLTPSGISPRAFPGQSPALVVTDSDEHDEAGHLIEDAVTRSAQVEKRMRKMSGLKQEIAPPLRYGPESAEITLIGWGGTRGAIQEAVDMLRKEGGSVNSIHLAELWPFPAEEMAKALANTRQSYVIENNATGQLSHLIRAETGYKVTGRILKYDGRPFTPAYIAGKVRKREVATW